MCGVFFYEVPMVPSETKHTASFPSYSTRPDAVVEQKTNMQSEWIYRSTLSLYCEGNFCTWRVFCCFSSTSCLKSVTGRQNGNPFPAANENNVLLSSSLLSPILASSPQNPPPFLCSREPPITWLTALVDHLSNPFFWRE